MTTRDDTTFRPRAGAPRHAEARPTGASSWLRSSAWPTVRDAVRSFFRDKAPRWSAALAFYTLFSFVPLVGLTLWIAAHFWNDAALHAKLLAQLRQLLGASDATQVEGWINRALPHGGDRVATVVGIVSLVLGATAVFNTVRGALNAVWGVEGHGPGGVWGFLRDRLLAFLVIALVALLMVVSLVASTAVSAWGGALQRFVPVPLPAVRAGELLVTCLLLWVLFALVFKWLPDARISWKDVWVGGAVTALLFVAGKFGIALYLGHSNRVSAYGVAGAMVLLLLWFYYSAMIFLLGAELTQVYARRWGSRILPERTATAAGFHTPPSKD